MPKPKPNESRDDYVSRCIPKVLDEGTAKDQEQAAAICNSMWRSARKEATPHDRLLDLVRARTEKRTEFNYGILTADRYVKRFLDEIGVQGCYRHMCRTQGDWTSFDDVMQKAAGTLSYINPQMELKAKGDSMLPAAVERPKNTLMVFRHVLTTSTKDRDGDILRTNGAKPDPKMLLLWQHVHTLPIGKMLAVANHTQFELQLYSCIVDMNELCHDAAVMVDNGMGRFSHGFRALDFLEIKEGRDSAGGFDVKEFEILEESLVSVPANPDAETEEVLLSLVEGGKLTSPLMKDYGRAVREHRPLSIAVKVFVNDQEVKSDANESRNEARGGEGSGAGSSEKAQADGDEGPETEKQTEVDEVKEKQDDEGEKVECPECGQEVVPDAGGECPKCGARIEGPETEKGDTPGHPFRGNQHGGGGSGSNGGESSGSTHSVKLPKDSRRLNIDTAAEALRQMGFKMKGLGFNMSKKQAEYALVDRGGKKTVVSAREARDMIYSAAKKEISVLARKVEESDSDKGKEKCPKCGKVVVPNKDDYCPECGADLYDFVKSDQKQLIDDSTSGGTLAAPPEQDYGRGEGKKMVCPDCDYVGPGKDGKCPECGAKLVPRKDFILEKLGRVLSKANEGKIRDAMDDLEDAGKMDGVPRSCKALINQARRSLGDVMTSLGDNEGVEKAEPKMDAKQALAVLLAVGGEKELKIMSSMLKAIEEGRRADEMAKQYEELFN